MLNRQFVFAPDGSRWRGLVKPDVARRIFGLTFAEAEGRLRELLPASVKKRLGWCFRTVNRCLASASSFLSAHGFALSHSDLMKFASANGLSISQRSDFYSPLPVLEELKKNVSRWYKPSHLSGIRYDLDAFRQRLLRLVSGYADEYGSLPSYSKMKREGFGPGFTEVDAMILYGMMREIKPRRVIEIGSGLSTFYCWKAAQKNVECGHPLTITCIDPYPCEKLKGLSNVKVLQKEVQDVELSFFDQLDEGDVLFVDSTHIVKIDGDVPYLYLEAIPKLRRGCFIHVHDIHFPYNVPFPSEKYVLGLPWPLFFNEAMLLQAFLSYNDSYEIVMSMPLLRFFCEDFLRANVPSYRPVNIADFDTHFGSIWIQKTK
jgi:hypothetical protein